MNIYKIAERVGCSPSTVARALRNKGFVSKEKKALILEVANEMGYQPNLAAKTLRNNRTNKVLFGIPDMFNPFYFKMIDGANSVLKQHGFYLMLFHTERDLSNELHMIDLLNQQYCDALIMVSFDFNEQNIRAIEQTNKPVVLTNLYAGIHEDANYDCVYVDHIKAMRLATNHLIDNGCQKPLLVIGDLEKQTSRERLEGYQQALKDHGLNYDPTYVINGDFRIERAYEAIKDAMQNKLQFDSIITANDLMGIGVLQYMQDTQKRVGQDYKMVTFDNTDFTLYATPPLTSIDLMQYEIGKNCATYVVERLVKERKKSKISKIEPTIIVRESSG